MVWTWRRRQLRILSFDRSLSALELALRPEHASAFGLEGSVGEAARALIEHGRHASTHTAWELRLGELECSLPDAVEDPADIVFWDPFSPRANPELWTCAAFASARRGCRADATLHTYSGATSVRAALLLAGFAVGLGELVSPGKHATCAATSVEVLRQPLTWRWFERLALVGAVPRRFAGRCAGVHRGAAAICALSGALSSARCSPSARSSAGFEQPAAVNL
ncbi:MAG: MnmC family methyltransferase [Deltaproteobacteria bacterium]